MGAFFPTFLALCLNCYGLLIFREPKEVGPGPLISCYIFMFATFMLLWDQRLYPRSLRRLWKSGQCIVEFFVADFIMESVMLDFWFPLETAAMGILPKLADVTEDMLQQGNWSCEPLIDFLRADITAIAFSYFISCFFLLAVLQATRAIDFRELEFGPKCFFSDIWCRLKRFMKKVRKGVFSNKKRVKLHEGCKMLPAIGNGDDFDDDSNFDYCPVHDFDNAHKSKC